MGTVFGMIEAFDELSNTGGTDPKALSGHISVALRTTAWGLVISIIAFLTLVLALIRFFTLPKPIAMPLPTEPTKHGDDGAARLE